MLQEFFRACIEGIIVTDLTGNITEANPAAQAMFGYSRDELIGTPVSRLYLSQEEHQKVITEVSTTGKFKRTILNINKAGSAFYSLLSANLIYGSDGEVIGMMGISRDIAEEISLKQKYEQLVNAVPDIIYGTGFEGKFTYVNDSVKRILGYDAEDLIGRLFVDLIHKPHQHYVAEHYRFHFEEKLAQSYLEFQVVKKDGDLLWVGQQVSTKFNVIEPARIEGFYGVVRDIDEQKRIECLLAESEEKYRELFDASTELIQSIDASGNFLYVNEHWKKAMGYTDEELSRLNLFALVHPDSQAHCSSLFADIIATGKFGESRTFYDVVSKDGRRITVEGAISIKLDHGRVVSVQSFLRDVSKQKEAERKLVSQEKTLRQITETLSDVFYLYNISEKKYEYISPNCETILGANSDFFYEGKSHTKKYGHPDDIEMMREANRKVDAGLSYEIDYRIIINGETRWINEKSFPITNDEGMVVANSGICRDVTDLKNAQQIIYKQNIEIGSSILYAKRLQDSVLPSTQQVADILPDSFIFYKPKEIVSGDFYVVDYIRTNDHEVLPALIVGDCTGHGIPGALLSLMCNVLVRESFVQHDVNSPSDSLDFVRKRLIKFFGSHDRKVIRDGMDIAFCVINKKANQVYYAGANSHLVIVRDGEILEHKGEKQHVGYNENYTPFSSHVIDIKKNDCLYLFSDGYCDQFGGRRDRKFTRKKFYQLLIETSHLPMKDVKVVLHNEFLDWKMENDQIDDITVLGVRIE